MARVVYWFRTDLRLHDSPALDAALSLNPECLWPIWCWDPHYVFNTRVGSNRFQFLIDCQNDVSLSITRLNPKSKLFVLRESPITVLPKIFKAWKVTHIVFESDPNPYESERDSIVASLAKKAGVSVITRPGRTLYDPHEITKANNGQPTMNLTAFLKAAARLNKLIPKPIPTPKSLPDPGDVPFVDLRPPKKLPDVNGSIRVSKDKSYDSIAGPNSDFSPPTLEQLGLPMATSPFHGGETHALRSLDKITGDVEYVAKFEKPNTAPTQFDPPSTTVMSPHLHFGSLSIRQFYWSVETAAKNYKYARSQPPTSLTGQMLFRDMYFAAQAATGPSFASMIGNPQAKFIPWDLPKESEHLGYISKNPLAQEWFDAWAEGRTGFPWIDAAMRQLRQEGWIHHLARHAVACFLTRGGCYIDWQRGAEVFEQLLIDHELPCNIGNWQWLSCTAFYAQYFKYYSPVSFPQKYDKKGDYVRRYVPELREFPPKFIYEPWKAPREAQEKAKCIVGKDYPEPIFDFNERRRVCMDRMKEAYHVGLSGNDPKVLDGTWTSLFSGEEQPAKKQKLE